MFTLNTIRLYFQTGSWEPEPEKPTEPPKYDIGHGDEVKFANRNQDNPPQESFNFPIHTPTH